MFLVPAAVAGAVLLAVSMLKKKTPSTPAPLQAITIQGRSGTTYGLQPIPTAAQGITASAVYLVAYGPNAAPPAGSNPVSNAQPGALLLRYSEQGNVRTLLDTQLPTGDPTLAIAKADFNIP
jgi:hypothetical protein